MAGFYYNNHDTTTILPSGELFTAAADSRPDAGFGMSRQKQEGSQTIARQITNEYGVIETPATLEFTLMKCGNEEITEQEQIIVENWLVNPTISQKLQFFPQGNKSIRGPKPYYYGVFTSTDWHPWRDGFYGVTVTFQATTAYPFVSHKTTVNGSGLSITKSLFVEVGMMDNKYVYPVVKIQNNRGDTLQITNYSEEQVNDTMTLTGLSGYQTVVVDCNNCLIYYIDDDGMEKSLTFTDIGWDDASGIYWLRLTRGTNDLEITASGKVTISYETAYRKVGDWIS